MNVEQSLVPAPFNLSADDIAWVVKTRDGLSTDEKVRQLFVHVTFDDEPEMVRRYDWHYIGNVIYSNCFTKHGRTRVQQNAGWAIDFFCAAVSRHFSYSNFSNVAPHCNFCPSCS